MDRRLSICHHGPGIISCRHSGENKNMFIVFLSSSRAGVKILSILSKADYVVAVCSFRVSFQLGVLPGCLKSMLSGEG